MYNSSSSMNNNYCTSYYTTAVAAGQVGCQDMRESRLSKLGQEPRGPRRQRTRHVLPRLFASISNTGLRCSGARVASLSARPGCRCLFALLALANHFFLSSLFPCSGAQQPIRPPIILGRKVGYHHYTREIICWLCRAAPGPRRCRCGIRLFFAVPPFRRLKMNRPGAALEGSD